MRTDGTTNLRRATKMKIGFLSGVTKPAHEGANALMLKSHSEPAAVVLLKSVFSSALDEKQLEQKVHDFLSNSWVLNDALYESAEEIAKDDSITDKQAALRDAVNEYIITMQQAAGITLAKNQTAEELEMSELEKFKALAGMTDTHKAYHESLSETDQEAFRKMDASAREAMVKLTKVEDESFTTISGHTVQKSVAGPMYDVLKSQDEQLRKAQTEAALAKAEKIVGTDYQNIPGELTQKTAMVLALDNLPEADRNFMVEKLKQADSLWKARKDPAAPLGGGNKGTDAMDELISEWMKANPGKTRAQAMTAVAATKKGQEVIESMRGDE